MTTEDNDATQTGVSAPDEDQKQEPTARELAMEAIAVNRESDEGQQQEAQIAVQTAAPAPVFADEKMLVKTKIDGVESEVSVADIVRQYQKNGAAERRLEEATRLLNEARAAQTTQQTPVGFAPPSQSGDSPASQEGDDEGKEFLAALFDGDETKALVALKKFGLGRQQPTLNPTQLAAQLTPAIKQQLVVDSALEKFEADYSDVMADPYLEGMTADFIKQEMASGKTFVDSLEVSGQRTRDWLASKGVKQQTTTPTTDRESKLERKARMDRIPALNSKAATQEEPEQNASDVINEMRRARGLTT